MKNKSVDKFIHIKESQGLCDTWRVRNPKKKRYTFRQQHVTVLIQRRLDYFWFQIICKNLLKKRSFSPLCQQIIHVYSFRFLKIQVYPEAKLYGNLTICVINPISLLN